MQFPVKAHYAVLATLAMAEVYEAEQLMTASAISKQQRIPAQFLGQILQQLRSSGLITSTRGASGGFRLIRPPADISAAEVIDAVCPRNNNPPPGDEHHGLSAGVHALWLELEEQQRDLLQQVSLLDLLDRCRQADSEMFYI